MGPVQQAAVEQLQNSSDECCVAARAKAAGVRGAADPSTQLQSLCSEAKQVDSDAGPEQQIQAYGWAVLLCETTPFGQRAVQGSDQLASAFQNKTLFKAELAKHTGEAAVYVHSVHPFQPDTRLPGQRDISPPCNT